jgi:gluconokinase
MTLPTLCPRAVPLSSPLSGVTPVRPVSLRALLAYHASRVRLRAVILIVAGVSGSGKTTVGTLLARMLRWRFADADSFHPEANVAKMRAGIPLTDADRAPWLRAVADWMDARIAAGESAVIACSALKRAYRDELLSGRPTATLVFLQVSREVLARRLATRPGHFFPEKLLDSQLETFEPPAPDERVHTVVVDGDAGQTATKVIAVLWPSGKPGADGTALPPGPL